MVIPRQETTTARPRQETTAGPRQETTARPRQENTASPRKKSHRVHKQVPAGISLRKVHSKVKQTNKASKINQSEAKQIKAKLHKSKQIKTKKINHYLKSQKK